jgi:hypothetical protein
MSFDARPEFPCGRTADLVPLQRVPAMLPGRPHRSTVFRWAQRGCRGVRLRTVSVGRTKCTTEAWLWEFFEQIAAARADQTPCPRATGRLPGRPRARIRRSREKTSEILRRHGLE